MIVGWRNVRPRSLNSTCAARLAFARARSDDGRPSGGNRGTKAERSARHFFFSLTRPFSSSFASSASSLWAASLTMASTVACFPRSVNVVTASFIRAEPPRLLGFRPGLAEA